MPLTLKGPYSWLAWQWPIPANYHTWIEPICPIYMNNAWVDADPTSLTSWSEVTKLNSVLSLDEQCSLPWSTAAGTVHRTLFKRVLFFTVSWHCSDRSYPPILDRTAHKGSKVTGTVFPDCLQQVRESRLGRCSIPSHYSRTQSHFVLYSMEKRTLHSGVLVLLPLLLLGCLSIHVECKWNK